MRDTFSIMTSTQLAAGEADGWSKSAFTLITELCIKHDVDRAYLGWGIHVPELNLLFYRGTTRAEIYDAFNQRPDRVPTVCFCDGSGMTSDKIAGIGVVIYRSGEKPVYIAENIGKGTNNVAELRAIWRALQAFPDLGQKLCIRTDSEYAIGSLTKTWNATANAELIANMRADLELRGNKVVFDHVDGHSGVEGNEIADQLANIGRKVITQVSL